jgi:hypothetical protein
VAQSQAAAQLKIDVERSEATRRETQQRLEALTVAHAKSTTKLKEQLAQSEETASNLREQLKTNESLLVDEKARNQHLQSQLALAEADIQSRKQDQQRLSNRLLGLEQEVALLQQRHQEATSQYTELQENSSNRIKSLQEEGANQLACIRNLEALVAGLQEAAVAMPASASSAQANSRQLTPMSPLSPAARSRNTSAANLLASPSAKNLSAAHLSPKPSSRDNTAQKELEAGLEKLKQRQAELAAKEAHTDSQNAVLAQQWDDLRNEQRMLETSAHLLHEQLLSKLSLLLPLDMAAIHHLSSTSLPGLTEDAVEDLRERVEEQVEITDAIETNIKNELKANHTEPHKLR